MRHTDPELRDLLAAAVAAEAGVRRPIVALARRTASYHSSWQMEDVDVTFDDGSTLSLVVKDLSPHALLDAARQVKPAFLVDPAREPAAYRGPLRRLAVDAPTFRGAVEDPAGGTYLLALERLDDATPLWQVGDFAVWQEAARALARMHDAALADPAWQSATPLLLRYDRAYYARWIGRAVRFCRGGGVAGDALARLSRLADRYDGVVDALLALPTTFIHGEFQPSNVLVQDAPTGGRARIRPIDWELAAVGPGLMDLADLCSGKWTPDQRAALAAAYRDASRPGGIAHDDDFSRALDLCRLHRAVQWLGWAESWTPPREHAHNWLDEALRLAETLGITGPD